MERVGVNITGPFPVTTSGNRFVLVAMDYLTKWPEAYEIPNHEATTVARALVDGFFTHGLGYLMSFTLIKNVNLNQKCLKKLAAYWGLMKQEPHLFDPKVQV